MPSQKTASSISLFQPRQTILFKNQLNQTLSDCTHYLQQKNYDGIKLALARLEQQANTIPNKQAFFIKIYEFIYSVQQQEPELDLVDILPSHLVFMIVLEDSTLTTLREFVQIINEFTDYHKKASYDISNPKFYRPSTYSEPSKQYEEIVAKIYPNLVKLLKEEPAKLLLPLAYNWCDAKLHNLKTETNLWHASTVGMVMRNVKKTLRLAFQQEFSELPLLTEQPSLANH